MTKKFHAVSTPTNMNGRILHKIAALPPRSRRRCKHSRHDIQSELLHDDKMKIISNDESLFSVLRDDLVTAGDTNLSRRRSSRSIYCRNFPTKNEPHLFLLGTAANQTAPGRVNIKEVIKLGARPVTTIRSDQDSCFDRCSVLLIWPPDAQCGRSLIIGGLPSPSQCPGPNPNIPHV